MRRQSFLVFHGGSGSSKEEIKTAVTSGVVKMNVDTGMLPSVPDVLAHRLTPISRYPIRISRWYPRLCP